MEKEYTPSTFSWIFYGLLAITLVTLGLYLLSLSKPGVPWFLVLLPLTMMAAGIMIGVNIARKKVIVNDNSILYISLFSTRQLEFAAIKGCRVSQKQIRLEPLSGNDHPVVIGNYSDLTDGDELSKWIKNLFTDLDAIDLTNHRQELAEDSRLGTTEADRRKYLAKSKDLALAYNIWGAVAGIALVFVKGEVASILLMTFPLLGVILMLSSRGTIKFVSSSAVSAYPFIMLGTGIPCFMVLFKSLIEYTLFQYDQLWLPALGISAIVFVLQYVPGVNKSLRSIPAQMVIMLILSLLYGFGSARLINCALDGHQPAIYAAKVLGHEINHGKSVTYYLDLSPWGPRADEQEVETTRDLYHAVAVGDSVIVNLKPGLLHIPWYTITKPGAH
jgi:hypothetical protein